MGATGETMANSDILKSLKVLYVEDDQEIRDQLSLFLRRRVGTLITAENGQEAMRRFREEEPDLLVTDILMPVMDGLELGRLAREFSPELPIIVTTAYNDEKFFLASIELGVDRYVLKPTDPRILVEAMEKCARGLLRQRERSRLNRYLHLVMDLNPNLMAVVADSRVEYLNKAFLGFLGLPTLEAFRESSLNPDDLLLTLDGMTYSLLKDGAWIVSLLEKKETLPLVQLRGPGAPPPLREPGDPEESPSSFVVSFNSLPEEGRCIFSFSDITRLEAQRREVREQAFTDPLTGTCNRARLQGLLNAEIQRSRRHESPLSIILLDIDGFQRVNETCGYDVGDEILRIFTRLINDNIRASEILARWGGEEFIIVSPESDRAGANALAVKLRDLTARTRFPEIGSITACFGVAQFQEGDVIRSLVDRADGALKEAKQAGPSRVVDG